MNDQAVLELIKEALFDVAPTRQEEFSALGLDTPIDDLALDSIAIMEMVGFIEDKLEVTFEEHDLAKVQNLRDLGKLIRQTSSAA